MGVCGEQCIRQISQYLQVSHGKCSYDKHGNVCVTLGPKNIETVVGFGTIVTTLAKLSKQPQFGKRKEDEALIRQWVEYAVVYGNTIDSSTTAHQVLKELNAVLGTRAYFVGNSQTLADVVLYCVLYNLVANFSYQDKERFLHLSRWFSNIQQDADLRQKNKLVPFSKTPLYS